MSVINRKLLKSQAGTAAFERGLGYFERGFVGSLRIQQHGVQAKVSGSHLYQVRLVWLNIEALRNKPGRNYLYWCRE